MHNKIEALNKLEALTYQGNVRLFYLCGDEDSGGNYTPATYNVRLTDEDDWEKELGRGTGKSLFEAIADFKTDKE